MKHFYKFFLIAVAMVIAIPSFAVTDREMEAARTMAAKHYLRYANNGSDYLDKLNPSSMAELSKSLKAKEKENVKAFNSVAVPKDYASWDKARLVEYWSNTFFKSSALNPEGKKCLGILAKNLGKLTVSASAPAPAPAPAAQETKPAQADAAQAQTPAAPAVSETPQSPAPDASAQDAAPVAEQDLEAVADADAGLAEEQPRKSSNTGWYVAVLVVLVGVVIWLVMYASKSMKESGLVSGKDSEHEIREAKRAAKEEMNKTREQYAVSLSAKNDEIKQLKAKCDELEAQLEETRRELQRMQSRAAVAARQTTEKTAARAAAPEAAAPESKIREAQPARRTVSALPPVVYLGYVNQRGLFVKASRSLNPDSSVYRMDIPDGHHGSFMVADDPAVFDRVMADVPLWLEGGCVIENPQDADIATDIMTLQAGEAVFADNTCRVVKKARVKFV